MHRNEVLRRQQKRSARGAIPGWLWGAVLGSIFALVVVGVFMRLGGGNAYQTQVVPPSPSLEQTPALATEPAADVGISAPAPDEETHAADNSIARQTEEIERLRQELEDLRKERETRAIAESAPTTQARSEPQQAYVEPKESRTNLLDEMAELERDWRPVFTEYQARYSSVRKEHDDKIVVLKQYKAQCSYTNVGEPNAIQRKQGVRQEGLPAHLLVGGSVDYAKLNCESIDFDIRNAEKDRFESLRDIQRECYDEAMARGVSTAKAKLR